MPWLCHITLSLLYSIVPPEGDVTKIVAVETSHVGCVRVARGVAGAAGTGLITKFADETQVRLLEFLTLTVYVAPAARPLKIAELCHVVPLRLYSRFVPNGDVTTIVPVVNAQVGWVTVASGVTGGVGTALITKLADETHV